MTSSSVTMTAAPRTQQLALWAGIVGPVLFTGVFFLDGMLTAGYSAIEQAISYLEVGAHGWIQQANFLLLGVLLLLFAVGFFRAMRPIIAPPWLGISTVLLGISAVGYINDSIFIAAAPGESPTALHVTLHQIGFEVIFVTLPLACFLIGGQLQKTVQWRGYGWYTLITGILSLIPALGTMASVFSQGNSHDLHWGGLINRVFVIEALGWYIVTALILLRMRSRSRNIPTTTPLS